MSRERILEEATKAFAAHGFEGARIADIARAAGLSHPSVLHHFGSKRGLYEAVVEAAVADWAAETTAVYTAGTRGFDRIAALTDAAFRYFATHGDVVRLVRREAIEGGERLGEAVADVLKPFVAGAVAFLTEAQATGELRPHDPIELIQVLYGSVFTYFSDAGFRQRLLDEDPLDPATVARHRDALTDLLRSAVAPEGAH
jgi:TetR/AcrR family transcriptional regulator